MPFACLSVSAYGKFENLFTISVETRFGASHQLTFSDGTKEPLHHHNWTVTAEVSSEKLNSMGLVMDFWRLKAIVEEVLGEFGSGSLEKISYFQTNNSSAENIARYIYEKIEPKLPGGVKLNCVIVAEEADRRAKFSKQ